MRLPRCLRTVLKTVQCQKVLILTTVQSSNEEVRVVSRERIAVYGQAYRYQSQGAVERFNQTIQMMIHRYLLQNHTNKYSDVLERLVDNYNGTLHETTKQKPIDLVQEFASKKRLKEAKVNIQAQADKILLKQQREFPELAVGDYVRVIQLKFQKEKAKIFDVKYRPEIYRVVSMRFHGNDYAYKITSNLEDNTGPFETVSRFQMKKVPAPDRLIKPSRPVVETPNVKLLAEKVHKPRKELPDVPELKRSSRVPTVKKVLGAGEARGKSYRRPA